jgi:hypothetical protein
MHSISQVIKISKRKRFQLRNYWYWYLSLFTPLRIDKEHTRRGNFAKLWWCFDKHLNRCSSSTSGWRNIPYGQAVEYSCGIANPHVEDMRFLCYFANIEANELSFPTSLCFLLPDAGSFPTLRFISVHGVHLHVHITCLRLALKIRFFSALIERARTWVTLIP